MSSTQIVFLTQMQSLRGKNHLCFPQAGDAASLRNTIGFTFFQVADDETFLGGETWDEPQNARQRPPATASPSTAPLAAPALLPVSTPAAVASEHPLVAYESAVRPHSRHEGRKSRTQRCCRAWNAYPHSKVRRTHGDLNEKWRPLT